VFRHAIGNKSRSADRLRSRPCCVPAPRSRFRLSAWFADQGDPQGLAATANLLVALPACKALKARNILKRIRPDIAVFKIKLVKEAIDQTSHPRGR
jgi:hypothetical protein